MCLIHFVRNTFIDSIPFCMINEFYLFITFISLSHSIECNRENQYQKIRIITQLVFIIEFERLVCRTHMFVRVCNGSRTGDSKHISHIQNSNPISDSRFLMSICSNRVLPIWLFDLDFLMMAPRCVNTIYKIKFTKIIYHIIYNTTIAQF